MQIYHQTISVQYIFFTIFYKNLLILIIINDYPYLNIMLMMIFYIIIMISLKNKGIKIIYQCMDGNQEGVFLFIMGSIDIKYKYNTWRF